MTEKPSDQDAQNTCAAEILAIPQDKGEPCTYCADEHPQSDEQTEQPESKPNKNETRRRRPRLPVEPTPKKRGNWFSRMSFPWKVVAAACALLSALGLGKCCADLPKQSPNTNCKHSASTPTQDDSLTVAQADQVGCISGRTTYQYQTINGIRQLISAKRVTLEGSTTAILAITRDSSGAACLVQLLTYDKKGKVVNHYSDTTLPNSIVLNKEFDLWTYFGQLN